MIGLLVVQIVTVWGSASSHDTAAWKNTKATRRSPALVKQAT